VKKIRELSAEELEGLLYSSNNYVKWKDLYLNDADQKQLFPK